MFWEILLSHHSKNEYYKCFLLKIGKREIRICARCFGFFLVFFFILGLFLITKPTVNLLFYVFIIVVFALGYSDWILTRLGATKSNNQYRLVSGMFLGIGGAALVYLVLNNYTNLVPYLIAVIFILIAFIVKSVSDKNKMKRS